MRGLFREQIFTWTLHLAFAGISRFPKLFMEEQSIQVMHKKPTE